MILFWCNFDTILMRFSAIFYAMAYKYINRFLCDTLLFRYDFDRIEIWFWANFNKISRRFRCDSRTIQMQFLSKFKTIMTRFRCDSNAILSDSNPTIMQFSSDLILIWPLFSLFWYDLEAVLFQFYSAIQMQYRCNPDLTLTRLLDDFYAIYEHLLMWLWLDCDTILIRFKYANFIEILDWFWWDSDTIHMRFLSDSNTISMGFWSNHNAIFRRFRGDSQLFSYAIRTWFRRDFKIWFIRLSNDVYAINKMILMRYSFQIRDSYPILTNFLVDTDAIIRRFECDSEPNLQLFWNDSNAFQL